jgi:hypothetical protein
LLVADYRSYMRRIESSKKGAMESSDATGCAV